MDQNRATPAVLNGRPCIPDALITARHLVEKDAVVKPGQLCSNLLHKFLLRPNLRKPPHVLQIAGRESLHLGECAFEIGRQTVDNLSPPAFALLPVEDVAPDLPVKQDQFSIDREGCTDLSCLNPALQVGKKLCVAVRYQDFLHGLDSNFHFPSTLARMWGN